MKPTPDNKFWRGIKWALVFTAILYIGALLLVTQCHAASFTIGGRLPFGTNAANYLDGKTDTLPYDGPCAVVAREVYRSLEGLDRHYLVGLLPGKGWHVVVLSNGMIYDPLWHSEPVRLSDYEFTAIQISESDGWHLAVAR